MWGRATCYPLGISALEVERENNMKWELTKQQADITAESRERERTENG